ncbi:hypothetical protein JXA47_12660 [Candidatus Sumerlaeota bacterium]|nr:hypothetical protein [Candidatus Sumerlaeota bacterium]
MGIPFPRCVQTVFALLTLSLVIPAPCQPTSALVFDGRNRNLFRVDLATGDRTLVSGTRWRRPELLLAGEAGTACVLDGALGTLDRVVPSAASLEAIAETGLFSATALAGLDATHAMAALHPSGSIVRVDLVTGDQQVLSSTGVGEGPPRRHIAALTAEDATHALAIQSMIHRGTDELWSDGLYRVDLTSGDWTPLVLAELASEAAENIDFMDPREVLPGDGEMVTILETNPPALTLVDTGVGVISNTSLILDHEGTPLVLPVAAIPRDAQSLWVLDQELEAIFTVDMVTGERTLVSREGERGDGPSLDFPHDMVLASDGSLWVLTGRTSQSLVAVDTATGNRQWIFDTNVGEGALPHTGPIDLVTLDSDTVLVLTDSGRELMEIDLATGDRTPLMQLRPPLTRIARCPAQRLWGLRVRSVVEIDLDTASETEIDLDFSDDQFRFGLTDVVQLSLGRALLSVQDFGASPSLWEINPLVDPPTLTPLFDDTESNRPHQLDHLAAADVDHFVFVDLSREDGYDEDHPGIHRFTRGELALVPVSTPATGSGAPMPDPRQLAIDEVDDVWIVNADPPALLRVELLSGLRTEISGPGRGAGPLWETATSMALLDGLPPMSSLEALLSHLLGTVVLEGALYDAADMDDSGTLDAADVVRMVGPQGTDSH